MKKKTVKSKAAPQFNCWIGSLSQNSLLDLHRTTGLPKSMLVFCGLQMFALAGSETRAEFISKYAKAKGIK